MLCTCILIQVNFIHCTLIEINSIWTNLLSRLSTVHIFGYMATTPRCIWKGFDKIHLTEKVITILEAEWQLYFTCM